MPLASVVQRLGDHTVRIWSPVVSRDSLGAEVREYAPGATVKALVNRPVAGQGDGGAGLAPTGARRIYVDPSVAVAARDIVEIVTGPETQSHRFWEVDGPPTRPRDNHTQLDCIAWHGALPEAS